MSHEGAMGRLRVGAGVRARDLRSALAAGSGLVELLMFRIGGELFATELAAVEEAVELEIVERLPEMPPLQLGLFNLRGRMMPLFSPALALGVAVPDGVGAALVIRVGGLRVAVGVEDVIDVLAVEASDIREPPALDDPGAVLIGVTRRDATLIAVIDARALATACLGDQAMETE